MKRRAVLGGALAAGLGPFAAVAQEDVNVEDAAEVGADVPNRATRKARIEIARRWEEEAIGQGSLGIIQEIASPDYTSPAEGNAPGIDALYDRFAAAADFRASRYTSFQISAAAFAVSGDSVSVRTVVTAEANGRLAETTGLGWLTFGADNLVIAAWGSDIDGALATQLFG